jgi:nucleotide-binding universal stress UspA family protein
MGWHGHGRKGFFFLGRTVDPVLERANFNVSVFEDCQQQNYRDILVLYAGGPDAAFALETASIMMGQDDGRIVVLHVAAPGRPTLDIDAFLDEVVPEINAPRSVFESKYLISHYPMKILLEEAQHHGLIIIGATRDPLFKQRVTASLPEAFVRDCKTPLVLVKAKQPIKSFAKRWI